MVKFVIVEDEELYIKKIINIIDKVMFNNNESYEIMQFQGCDSALKKEIRDTSIEKVYILDIQLKGRYSGLDIAKLIRNTDWDNEIIFTTSHDNMFETVYRTVFKIFSFIEKFQDMESRLDRCLRTIINQKCDTKKFTYSNSKIEIQIYLKDILYIYRDTIERKLVIRTYNNNFLVNLNIADILPKVDKRFVQVHRACIVNSDHVSLYNWTKGFFILDTKEKVNMCSKGYRSDGDK